ncbi:EboA domain-containing protein [Microbacterium sp. LMI1-1-1.1]|uniref:EboA domain-containing protein n=1 Tax=Microbacterium sp. LMI1-1-1.1 TaxID=3135223 RepID=UPI00346798FC
MTDVPWTWGYGTNGFADHALPDALDVLQATGYGAVALTLGHPHLDPFASDWRAEATALAGDLRRRGLRVVVETGARYLLDPFVKHRPTLVDRDAERRMAFLRRAIEIAEILDADCVSLWSGVLPDDVGADAARVLLDARLAEIVGFAASHGVVLALEPEPGMLVETVADAVAVRARLGHPANLGLTVDLGHCVVVEPEGVVGALRAAGPLLRNVQADDMRPDAHEHLPFGEGELDLTAALATLGEIGYRGVVAVELPRHSHAAPALARHSLDALRAASLPATAAGIGAAASPTGGDAAGGGPSPAGSSSAPGIPSAPGTAAASPTGGDAAGGGPSPAESSSAPGIPSAPDTAATSPTGGDAAGGGPSPAESSSAPGIPSVLDAPHPWTVAAVETVRTDAARAARLFAEAGRQVGRDPLDDVPYAPTADDAARAALIVALAEEGTDPAVVTALYDRGDDAERRGVLRGLNALVDGDLDPRWRDAGRALMLDALRTNDTRLVAVAMGAFSARHLDDHAWRHGVLKLAFLGIPFSVVHDLTGRADDELAAMAARFAEERRAAGRSVPDDLALVLPALSQT